MVDLWTLISNDSTWSNLTPAGINDGGQIIGTGSHNGRGRAFLMTPVTTTSGGSSGGGYIEVLP